MPKPQAYQVNLPLWKFILSRPVPISWKSQKWLFPNGTKIDKGNLFIKMLLELRFFPLYPAQFYNQFGDGFIWLIAQFLFLLSDIELSILEWFGLGQLTFHSCYISQETAVFWDQRYLASQISAAVYKINKQQEYSLKIEEYAKMIYSNNNPPPHHHHSYQHNQGS